MRRAVVIAAVGAAAAIVAAYASYPAGALKGPGIVRITSKEKRFTRVDTGAAGRSPGDLEVSTVSLYNKAIRKKPLGHGQLVCVLVGNDFRNCNGTFVLPAGKIVVSGGLIYRGLYDLAVTGGTGLYNNVRGTLTVTRLGRNPTQDLLVFRLVV